MKKILLSIHLNTYFNELHRVAELLRSSERYEPIVWFPHNYPNRQKDIDRCLDEGFHCIDIRGARLAKPGPVGTGRSPAELGLKHTIKRMIRRLGLMPLAEKILSLTNLNNRSFNNVLFEIMYLRSRIAYARRIYRRHSIHLVILGGDAVHYDTSSFIRAATLEGIPSMIVPCTMSNAEEMAESYWPIKKYHLTRWQNKLFAKIRPQWVYVRKERPLLRLPAEQAWAMEILKLAPPQPWMNLSGYADVIATESEAMVEYYTRDGIPRSQLEVTGSLADDELWRTRQHATMLRSRLYQQLGLPDGKPMLLATLPPDQLYMEGGRPECEFTTYEELITSWLKSLSLFTDYNVIADLHPSMKNEEKKHWGSFGVKISHASAASLIPLADIFVASVSTIIRWAILCAVPVVNYDVYRFRYHDYSGLPGVIAVEKQADFVATVQRLTGDRAYYEQVKNDQAKISKRWGMLDGQVGHRMLALIDRLTERRP